MFQSDLELVKLREGLRLHWYRDSEGKKTGGYGHLWRKGDPAVFDLDIANTWLEKDISHARSGALKLLALLPIQTASLRDVLVSVCFQLGNDWYKEHKKTWKLMLEGNYNHAAVEAQNSDWYRQTPMRVKDLQRALYEAAILGRSYSDLGL
jgi:GH24 family phage-related lysozyme (muramidase)